MRYLTKIEATLKVQLEINKKFQEMNLDSVETEIQRRLNLLYDGLDSKMKVVAIKPLSKDCIIKEVEYDETETVSYCVDINSYTIDVPKSLCDDEANEYIADRIGKDDIELDKAFNLDNELED